MEHSTISTRAECRVEQALGRAFLTAHLLTANLEQAEQAVCEAIDSFDADCHTADELLHDAIRAVVRRGVLPGNWNSWPLPGELHAVLSLPPNLRHCYVLRILAGISQRVCAVLLGLNTETVDRFTCEALRLLVFKAAHRDRGAIVSIVPPAG